MNARCCLLLVLLFGCARQSVDRVRGVGSETSDTKLEDVPVKGHDVVVELGEYCKFEGELLAQDWRSLWVLTDDRQLVRVPTARVRRVLVELYASGSLATGVVTTVGTLSTVTHGFFLVLTGPAWLISGITSSVYESQTNDYGAKGSELDSLWRFARYPQGPPLRLAVTPTTPANCTQ